MKIKKKKINKTSTFLLNSIFFYHYLFLLTSNQLNIGLPFEAGLIEQVAALLIRILPQQN